MHKFSLAWSIYKQNPQIIFRLTAINVYDKAVKPESTLNYNLVFLLKFATFDHFTNLEISHKSEFLRSTAPLKSRRELHSIGIQFPVNLHSHTCLFVCLNCLASRTGHNMKQVRNRRFEGSIIKVIHFRVVVVSRFYQNNLCTLNPIVDT